MIMFCMFLPPVLALTIQTRRKNLRDDSFFSKLSCYCSWTIFSNMLVMASILFVFKKDGITSEAFNSFRMALVYTVLNVFTCVVMPYVVEVLRKLISVSFVIEKKDGEEKVDE